MEIADLLDRRERVQLTHEEMAASNERLRQAILTLWQTSMLRRNRLTVLDEVANGLSYYDYAFLREVPRLFSALQDDLQASDPADRAVELASFLRIGSWIGGDRDGNPFVTAEVLGETLRMQSTRACRFYLDELHELGAELSLSNTIVGVSPELRELAGRSPD
jgi:phosphoenolpyruvate carboxylase